MTHVLLATDSVHTTAAACDYLEDRLVGGDRVTALAVVEPGSAARDAPDALNVATVRLGAVASVETAVREGEPAAAILSAADEWDVDEVVVGPRGGVPGADVDIGGTARAVLAASPVPVVVVPTAPLG